MPSTINLGEHSPRHSDTELLQLRLETIRDEIVPRTAETDSLSPWQQDVLSQLNTELRPDQTIDLPTRTGKSYLIREIAKTSQQSGVRVAVVSHRRHILQEHADKLTENGAVTQDIGEQTGDYPGILLLSVQSVAVNETLADTLADKVDLVLVDEAHRALGEKTVEGMRGVFPNAVRIAFTATPDYAADRSVTDEYGDKLTSRSVVEAIERGYASPVRAFLYKTDAVIDNLDPNMSDFTPRELKRLADLLARNQAIVDVAQDLIGQGRQGLVTTIPGEDLLHADTLKKMIEMRHVTDHNGFKRTIRAHVVRGGDFDLAERLEDFEDGAIDVLLYCDLLREGYSTDAASFVINGRPTTSIVNLTQDVGRVLQPKHIEAVVVDFQDNSVKQQRTVYDVLELDRSVQGVYVGPPVPRENAEPEGGDTYMRGLFRPALIRAFQAYDNQLIAELSYNSLRVKTPLEKRRDTFERERVEELAKQTKIWEKLLAKEGLQPEIGPDVFGALSSFIQQSKRVQPHPDGTYTFDILPTLESRERLKTDNMWPGFEHRPVILPVTALPSDEISTAYDASALAELQHGPEQIAINASHTVRKLLAQATFDLEPMEQKVIAARFGLDGTGTPKTLEEVGRTMDRNRERIRQIEARALSKLRHPKRSNDLRFLLGEPLIETDEVAASLDAPQTVVAYPDGPRIITPEEIARNRKAVQERDKFYEELKEVLQDPELFEQGAQIMLALFGTKGIFTNFRAQRELLGRLEGTHPGAILDAAKYLRRQELQYQPSSSWKSWSYYGLPGARDVAAWQLLQLLKPIHNKISTNM